MDDKKQKLETEQPEQGEKASGYETLYQKHKGNIYFHWGLTAVVVVIVCILASQLITKLPAIYAAIRSAVKTLSAVFYGLCIAYVLDPIVERVERFLEPKFSRKITRPGLALRLARGVGILVALVVLGFLVWAILALVLKQLSANINDIITHMPDYYNNISSWVLARTSNAEIAGYNVGDYLDNIMNTIYDQIVNYLTNSDLTKLQSMLNTLTTLTNSVAVLVKGIINLFVGIIVAIYLLDGKDRFLAQSKKILYAALNEEKANTVSNVCTFANHVFGGFIGGKLVDSAIIGVLCFIGMSIFGMKYPALISVIIGCTNIIPVFGPFLGAIPSTLFLLVANNMDPMSALKFVLFIVVLQQLDGNVIGPIILGDATGLGSFWVVVSILIFGGMWGIPGMIIGVPLFAVIYKLITELVNYYLTKRGLSTVTADYAEWNYPQRHGVDKWKPETRRQKRKKRRELRALKKLEGLDPLHLLHREEKTAAEKSASPASATEDKAAETADPQKKSDGENPDLP